MEDINQEAPCHCRAILAVRKHIERMVLLKETNFGIIPCLLAKQVRWMLFDGA